jgi:hypothetical protein
MWNRCPGGGLTSAKKPASVSLRAFFCLRNSCSTCLQGNIPVTTTFKITKDKPLVQRKAGFDNI